MVTSPYEGNILEWDFKQNKDKQKKNIFHTDKILLLKKKEPMKISPLFNEKNLAEM